MATETTTPSRLSNYPQFMEKFSDWFNPILVKEIRRSIKSREFVITFLLLVFVSWVISVFGMLAMGSRIEFGSPSRDFFISYYMCMCFAIMVVVPFSAYRSMMSEQEHQTLEILNITTLSPRKIVWGKLLTAIVQMFLFYCVVAPFVSFTSLLQGYDLARSSYLLYLAGFFSILITIFSLMLTTNIKGRMWKNLMVGGMLFGLLILYSSITSTLWGMFYWGSIEFDTEFYISNLCMILFGMAVFYLCEQVSISALTFESDDRSSGIRFAFMLIYLLGAATVLVYRYFYTSIFPDFELFVFSNSGLMIWAILGFFSVGYSDFLSRRIRINLAQTSFPFRVIRCFLVPGGTRALMVVLTGIAINLILTMILITKRELLVASIIASAYVVIYLGFQCWMMRLFSRYSNEAKPLHGGVITMLILALGVVFPLVVNWVQQEFYRKYNFDFSIWCITNPFYTIYYASGGNPEASDLKLPLVMAAILVLVLNIRAISSAIREVMIPKNEGPSIKRQDTTSEVRGMAVD